MTSTPVVSFSTIGILSDILKELPLVNYVESSPDSNDSSGYPKPNEPGSTMHKLALLESAIQRERATKLLESSAADQNFVDVLTKTLSLIDTSKISMKPEFVKPVPGLNELPPLLRSSISYNPKLFNGVFQDRLNQAATTSQVRPNNEQSHVLKQEQTPPKSAYLADNQKQNYNNATISHPSQAKQQDLKSIEESIQTKKFYSSSTSSMTTQPQQPQPKKEPKKEPNHQQMQLQQQQQQQQHKQGANKVALSTWQADLASQLALPDDFTPELISMLAAEGYDVVSAATSRKPRSRATQQHQQHQQKMLDLSDDDDDEEKDVYQPATSSKTAMKTEKKSSEQQSVVRPMPLSINKQAARSELLKYEDPTEHPSFKRFAQMLDDLLESYESELQSMTASRRNGENLGDDVPSEYLMPKQTCSELVQEAFKLSSYSILHLIRTDCLFKLQNLLFYNIKDGVRSLHLMNEDKSGGHQQDKVFLEILHEKLLRASDCSIVALIIMTSPQMPKEIVIEDVIEQIASFVKLQLTETIFPAYDSVYKPVAVPSSSDSKPTPSSKRKLANQFNTAATSSTAGGGGLSAHRQKQQMNYYYTRIREMLSLVGDLICQIDLTDTIVITLTSFSVMCFFVENINELQLEALKILTNLFSRYPKHRQLVIDDILSSLAKIHPSKRNSRTYKCFNGDSIQMFTALVLQLLQSEVSPIDYVDSALMTSEDYSKRSYEEKESYLLNSFEDANQTAKKFLSVFFSKCKTKQADVDYRPLFESFIQDLLTIVNKPEWPIAEIILNMLGIVLVNQVQNDQSDVSSRVNSLEYLGQIVSQLRKDSLEYQKYPERVTNVLEKIKSDPNEINNVDTNLTNSDLFSMQKSLIAYLDSLLGNDAALQFSKYFLVAQWLKELCNPATKTSTSESSDNTIEIHSALYNQRKRVYELIERTGTIKNQQQQQTATTTTTSLQLDINEALTLTKYLCSLKKTLDKNFDFYLITILNLSGAGLETNTPTQVRSKAIKCLSLIIEVDPQILLKPKVYACVEANFLHPTISVREASVDLIGKFISHKPELTNHYYKLLSDRILDVGVSVRKRVIKIFRDICLNQPEFEALSEVCVKILRRIVDEDNIKKLVIETFYSLWFAPLNNNKEALLRRVLNMVDVVSEFSIITNIQNLELFEILFSSLLSTPNSASGGSSSAMSSIKIEDSTSSTTTGSGGAQASNEQELQAIRSKDVVRSCKQIVDCLISNVLNTEANASSPQAYKRLVASFATLFLLSKIKPDNFVNHAETLLPYLNIKSTNQNDNQIINSAAKILECVVPLLQSPSNSFLISLEESLCKLIFQGGMMIVSSCISCLGTVINKLTKNYKLAADCLFKFYNNAVHLKRNIDPKKPMEAGVKPSVLRMLFTLGLLAKHFDVESEELREFNKASTSKQELFDIFLYFVRTFGDVDVQQKALNGLGSFLTRNSEYMMRDEIKSLYMDCMKRPDAPINLKSQVFMNLTDYLAEEDQKNLTKSVELSKSHTCKDDLKEMLDVQSGMASTIIQSYLRPILDSYLTSNGGLRTHVFNCLSLILNQGLVYPIECVPYLIAMTTDPEKKIQTKALTQLTSLQKAHPNFVQTKSIMGINVSFHLQSIIKRAELAIKMQQSGESSIDPTMRIIRGFSELTETLSLNHHLYSLLRTNKNNRRAFLQQILKMFDDSSLNHHTNLAHMLYLADNLAYFPYQLMDEPLYLIHQIDLIISVTGINLLQMFRENLLNHRETASMRQAGGDEINREASNEQQQQQQQLDLGLDCPDEADDDMANNSLRPTNIGNNSNLVDKNGTNNGGNKNQMDDDEEETFESVFSNLPADLKPLKDCMYKAQGCCLLLILKQFLKEVYSISDSKIQNYSPTDTAKVNDRPITSRKTNRRFNPKKIMDYILRSDRNKEENEETKQALVTEYLEFKELMLSIDQEEKIDENKPNNPGGSKTNAVDASKLALLHQKLFEGIEKTKGTSNGQDSVQATPKSKAKSSKSANRSSTKKGGAGGKSSAAKRKRKNDSDLSSESDSNSDFDDED